MATVAEASKPLENASTLDTLVRFHLALNVPDMDRSVTFYRALFGAEPKRWSDGFAKFVLEEPPLVLSLVPHGHAGGGPLNHIGIRLNDSKKLIAAQVRLKALDSKRSAKKASSAATRGKRSSGSPILTTRCGSCISFTRTSTKSTTTIRPPLRSTCIR